VFSALDVGNYAGRAEELKLSSKISYFEHEAERLPKGDRFVVFGAE
jgi:hypothetical protein